MYTQINFLARTNCTRLGELLFSVKTSTKLLASQLRIEGKGEVQTLLAEVDSIKREVAQWEGTCWDLQQQVKLLQGCRSEMLAEMGRMVPQSELDSAREEAVRLRKELVGLQNEAASAQHERECLVSMMQVIVAHRHSPVTKSPSTGTRGRGSRDIR